MPEQTRVVRTPRYTLPYSVRGSGPPLVLVHGLNDVPASFAPLIDSLQSDFTCMTYQLPEGTRDGAVLHTYTHRHFVEDLIALLDHLTIETAFVLGSSFGSTITLCAAAKHPARFLKVILQGGFARRPLKPVEQFLARLGRSWPWRMGQLPIRHRVMKVLEAQAFEGHPAALAALIEHSGESAIKAVTHRARLLETLDLRPLLPGVVQPVLMIGGDRDAIVPRWCEAEVEAGVPNVRRVEFERCGHYPQYTQPRRMAEVIREFLQDPPTSSRR
jgi:pimeloyl-ACP methyl ester carboxylesterase